MLHGATAAERAAETARQVFEQGTAGDDLPTLDRTRAEFEAGIALFRAVVETGLAKSNGEARRLIEQGGVRINDEPVADAGRMIGIGDLGPTATVKLTAGRKRHALIRAR